ncbi:MAG: phage holin family protein [Firmicutes bacterium]|nr:phage holin family protein [Bacillota bacterium]
MDWIGAAVRFVVSALVLMLVGFILPGFKALTFFHALLAAVVIAVLGWVVESLLGRSTSPYGRGIVGFLVSALIVWATQFVVPEMSVSIVGALLAAFVIGIIDMFVPTALR